MIRAALAAVLLAVAGLAAADKPLTQHQKLDLIRAQLERIERAVGIAPKPAELVVVAPKPAPAANPFVAWKAAGFDLVHVQRWILGRGLTPGEIEQARAAGYFDEGAPPASGSAPAPVQGTNLAWSNGRWVFLPSQAGGAAGQLTAYSIGPVPAGYVGGLIVSIGQTSQNNPSDSPEFTYWLEDSTGKIIAGPHRTANSNGNVRLQVAPPGSRYTFKAQNLSPGRATVQLNHS